MDNNLRYKKSGDRLQVVGEYGCSVVFVSPVIIDLLITLCRGTSFNTICTARYCIQSNKLLQVVVTWHARRNVR